MAEVSIMPGHGQPPGSAGLTARVARGASGRNARRGFAGQSAAGRRVTCIRHRPGPSCRTVNW